MSRDCACHYRNWLRRLAVLVAIVLISISSSAFGQESAHSHPQDTPDDTTSESGFVCTGYNPLTKKWGWRPYEDQEWIECPPHYAFFGTGNPPHRLTNGLVKMAGNCCPLPKNDILTDNHVIVDAICPDGYVVTSLERRRKGKEHVSRMRCTRINTEKYTLGTMHRGVHWGVGTAASFPWSERKFIRIDEIPRAIWYGLRRRAKTELTMNGCVGEPIGSLFVAKRASNCKGLFWRRLYYRFPEGGSEDRRPVKMFPDCRAVKNSLSHEPECIPPGN